MGHLDFAGSSSLLQSSPAIRRSGIDKRGRVNWALNANRAELLKPLPPLQRPSRVPDEAAAALLTKKQDSPRPKQVEEPVSSRITVYDPDDGGDAYRPNVGDVVVGMVVSGNASVLDIDIGAQQPGVLFTRDMTPLDKLKVEDRLWCGFESAEPPPIGRACIVADGMSNLASSELIVEAKTVLQLLVIGITLSGRALLSVRNFSRPIAWQRMMEIYRSQGVVEVCIEAYNVGGLICRIEGLTAFLPKDMIQSSPRDPTRLKDYIGKRLFVLVIEVDEPKTRIIVNERAAWVQQLAPPHSLVEGVITKVQEYGVIVRIDGTELNALLHVSNMSNQGISSISDVFSEGDRVKAVVLSPRFPDKVILSTAVLEQGERTLAVDKEGLFRDAEETYKAWRIKEREWRIKERESDDSSRSQSCVRHQDAVDKVANMNWLHFEGMTM